METAVRHNGTLRPTSQRLRPAVPEDTDLYPTERNLVQFAQRRLQKLFAPSGASCLIDCEVGVGRSIADLVLLIAPKGQSCPPLPPLSVAESVILASLRLRGPTRIDILEVRCGFKRHGLRQGALKRLLEVGILVRERGGRVALGTNCVEASKIIAVEAKLTKWREALYQAALYRRYADEAHVLLPAHTADPAMKADAQFAAAGVGLLIATEKKITRVFTACPSMDHDWRRDFVYFRLLTKNRGALPPNGYARQPD